MRLPRELKMTTVCKACAHQYGTWRPRCPACGNATPAPPPPLNPPRIVRRREPHPTECVFCRTRGAKDACPFCTERIHKTCLRLHAEGCQRFIAEINAHEERLKAGSIKQPT